MEIVVQVVAGARKERVERTGRDSFSVAVKEKAAHNMANTRVRELIARKFGIPLGSVRIQKGHRSPKKVLFVMV